MNRRFVTALWLVICALLVAGCGKPAPSASSTPIISTPAPVQVLEEKAGSTLTLALCGEMEDFHPLLTTEKEARSFMGLVFESLVEIDKTGAIVPCLASSWTADNTGTLWTFALRSQVVWQGTRRPFTAQDVVFTLDLIREIGDAGPWAQVLDYVSDWKALDEKTLELTFTHPFYGALYALDFPIVPCDGEYTASDAPLLLLGTGPYEIRDITPGENMTLGRNDSWWRIPPAIEKIVAVFYQDLDSATSALSLRQVDVVETTTLTTEQYKYGNSASVYEYNTSYFECLYFNYGVYILQNKYIRQAISYAVDRSGICDAALVKHAVVVDAPIPPSSFLYSGSVLTYTYDPDEAKRLLARTGWKDTDGDGFLDTAPSGASQEITLRLVTSGTAGNSIRSDMARLIEGELEALGFRVEVEVKAWDDFQQAAQEGDFDLLLAGSYMGDVPDWTEYLATDGALNLGGYTDPQMDTLLSTAREAVTADALKDIMAEIREKIKDEVPLVSLCFRTHSLLLTSHVQGVSQAREADAYCGIADWYLDRSLE